jgi:Predicted methyltransferase regulatory domain
MWNEGYTAEIDYISGYYSETSPARIRLALLANGVDHSISDNPDYLELGFGQGLSLAINAATSSVNPGQVANARELAGAMGKPLTLLEDSFEELLQRSDLPSFDIIALHGIWSWISEGSRAAIVEIARKWLKPGGAMYISYNVTPGWSPGWPLRILLAEHAKREGSGRITDKVDGAIAFVEQVIGANAAYFQQNPSLAGRLENIKKQNKTYVAHEYFNANWDPMPFSQVADRLSEAKLTFAASAAILENLASISIPVAAHPILQAIKDPVMRETTRDYFINQQFRRDIFVKGPRGMTAYDHGKRIEKERFVLLGDPEKCPEKVATVIGEADLKPEAYQPLAKALAGFPDATASVAELMTVKELASLNRAQIWEVLLVLTGAGYVGPVGPSTTPVADEAASRSLNALLLEKADANTGVDYLAAPRLGAAINISRIDQMFMRALLEGDKDPVERIAKILAEQNQNLIVEGEPVTDPAKSRQEIARMLAEFKGQKIELLKRLGAY